MIDIVSNSKDSYCAALFRHMVYRSDGSIRPCCSWNIQNKWEYDQQYGIKPARLDPDPFNHSWLDNIRQEMLENRHVPACYECYERETAGVLSMREGFNSNYGRPVIPELRYLEFNIGNLCNMKCRMCDSWSSSKWIADEQALGIPTAPVIRPDMDGIPVDVSHLDKLRFVGGEPTLEQPTLLAVLNQILAARGSLSHLTVTITTNCLVLLNAELLELLNQCKLIDMQCSIDGFDKVNDYQRTGSVWSTILDNLLWYQDNLNKNYYMVILTTWSLFNATNAKQWLTFVLENLHRYHVWGHTVREPAYLSIHNAPDNAKKLLADQLTAWVELDHIKWVLHNKQVIQSQLAMDRTVPIFADIDPLMYSELVSACKNIL